jgi:hypothetical protein
MSPIFRSCLLILFSRLELALGRDSPVELYVFVGMLHLPNEFRKVWTEVFRWGICSWVIRNFPYWTSKYWDRSKRRALRSSDVWRCRWFLHMKHRDASILKIHRCNLCRWPDIIRRDEIFVKKFSRRCRTRFVWVPVIVYASLAFETFSFETTTKPMVSLFLRYRRILHHRRSIWSSCLCFLILLYWPILQPVHSDHKSLKDREWSFQENQHFDQILSMFHGMNASISKEDTVISEICAINRHHAATRCHNSGPPISRPCEWIMAIFAEAVSRNEPMGRRLLERPKFSPYTRADNDSLIERLTKESSHRKCLFAYCSYMAGGWEKMDSQANERNSDSSSRLFCPADFVF